MFIWTPDYTIKLIVLVYNMKIVITEEQYKSLINENLFKDTLKDLKINTGILFTFGTGMGAFMGPVERLLTGSGFSFNQTEISLLIISAIANLINDTNKDKLLEKLKELDLTDALNGVENLIKKSTDIIRSTVKGVLGVSYSLAEILGFAFLLNPVMKIIGSIINDRNITTDNLQVLVSGVVVGGIVFFIRNLLKKSKDNLGESFVTLKEDIEPSEKAVKNICDSKKFCKAQGKITFGQLRELVENAKTNRLFLHIGEGGYKATLRLLPWFFPQLAIAGFTGSLIRAFNKVFRPTLEETTGYKTWWGKTIMKIFNLVEGELGTTDPLSKIFFISDGLMTMLDDKLKVKFARYIADIASEKPDDEEVPEFFVENELRHWLNEKFLLDPPLSPKNQTIEDRETLDESYIRLSEDNTDNLLGYLYEMGFDNDDALYQLNDITDFYDNLPETLTLYRMVFAGSKDEIDTQYPGSHYATNKNDLLDSHYTSLRDSSYGDNCYVIKVKAQKQLIDSYESIKNNILYPNEQEITLKNKGFGVDVIEIMQVN
jgi:hypothetical protein